jgi:hypothetical protein
MQQCLTCSILVDATVSVTVGRKIQQGRQAKGLTQPALASVCLTNTNLTYQVVVG